MLWISFFKTSVKMQKLCVFFTFFLLKVFVFYGLDQRNDVCFVRREDRISSDVITRYRGLHHFTFHVHGYRRVFIVVGWAEGNYRQDTGKFIFFKWVLIFWRLPLRFYVQFIWAETILDNMAILVAGNLSLSHSSRKVKLGNVLRKN